MSPKEAVTELNTGPGAEPRSLDDITDFHTASKDELDLVVKDLEERFPEYASDSPESEDKDSSEDKDNPTT